MKKIALPFAVLACFTLIAACSSERHTRTTTRETVESAPANPVTIEKRTTTQTETRSPE